MKAEIAAADYTGDEKEEGDKPEHKDEDDEKVEIENPP